MGAAASAVTIGECVQILQQGYQTQRDETWARRGHGLGLQSMRIDILNTVREEMRDQVTVIISSLDNLMVVATLMLSIGFGFAVEGTFPASENDYEYSDIQRFLLVLYAFLSALSLVFPLACLMMTIAARFEVELCQQDVMSDLQRHLLRALRKDRSKEDQPLLTRVRSSFSKAQPAVHENANGQGGASAANDLHNGGPRSMDSLRDLVRRLGELLSEGHVGRVAEDEVQMLAEGLLQKVNHYHTLYPIAQLFLWLGMLCSVLVCSVLLGLYFAANFPETPWMWRIYSGILLTCAILCGTFYVWMRHKILRHDGKPGRPGQQLAAATATADHERARCEGAPFLPSCPRGDDVCPPAPGCPGGEPTAPDCGPELWPRVRQRFCRQPPHTGGGGGVGGYDASDSDHCFESVVEDMEEPMDDPFDYLSRQPTDRVDRTPPSEGGMPRPRFASSSTVR